MVTVITKNTEQFESFCNEAKILVHSPEFKNLRDAYQLRGTINPPVILYGEYYKHHDWYNIEKMLLNRVAVFVKLDKELNDLIRRGS